MNIIVGTTSAIKVSAVTRACALLGIEAVVTGVKKASIQNEQPCEFTETCRGAEARAMAAQATSPESLAIGIESGIFRIDVCPPITLDIAVIVLLTADGRRIVTTSQGMLFPEVYVHEARLRGFETTTVGSIIAERLGGNPNDPHATLTGGRVMRKATLIEAVCVALLQL